MLTVSCQECGRDFSAQRMSAKFCSTNCRVKFNNRTPEEIAKKEKELELAEESTFEPIKEQKDVVPFVKPTPEIKLPKVSGVAVGADVLKNTPKTLFQLLLIEFNDLVLEQPPVSQIRANLESLIVKSQNSELTLRQSEAIRERCVNYINGTYGVSAKKEAYNNNNK